MFGTFLQIFGSPFFKSTFIFWSLAFGCIISAASNKGGNSYWDADAIDAAPGGTFLWVGAQFPLGFDVAYLLPILICYWVTAAETVGDVTMTAYYSRIYKVDADTGGPATEEDEKELESRVQGGLL